MVRKKQILGFIFLASCAGKENFSGKTSVKSFDSEKDQKDSSILSPEKNEISSQEKEDSLIAKEQEPLDVEANSFPATTPAPFVTPFPATTPVPFPATTPAPFVTPFPAITAAPQPTVVPQPTALPTVFSTPLATPSPLPETIWIPQTGAGCREIPGEFVHHIGMGSSYSPKDFKACLYSALTTPAGQRYRCIGVILNLRNNTYVCHATTSPLPAIEKLDWADYIQAAFH